MTTRPNGLPALRDLPITFARRTATAEATAEFTKLVGKSTDRATHAPTEYVSEDGRWVIRCVKHSGYGSTNSGRTRWHVSCGGRYFPVGLGTGSSALSLEDAIDEIHRKIARGVCLGFEVLAKMRRDAQKREEDDARHAANLSRAKDLLGRVCGADPGRLVEQLARHVDLDTLARAVERAEATQP
ncbi:MAG TPA: hypothetical protein VLE97_09555 [Gaiellaceae bacterium]|nr:hypothetical protein [Gaiellaceae bacterium]